jgi:hypothetical protein
MTTQCRHNDGGDKDDEGDENAKVIDTVLHASVSFIAQIANQHFAPNPALSSVAPIYSTSTIRIP